MVLDLLREYVNWLGIDIALRGLETELAEFPGKFGPPAGELLLARSKAAEALGCVGLRPLEIPETCEVKRFTSARPPAVRGSAFRSLRRLSKLQLHSGTEG